MIRKTLSAIGRGFKGITMRWAGQGRPWWSAGRLPGTRFDYAKEVGDGSRSNIVVAVVNWIARTFPEAPVMVVDEKPDGGRERVPGHPMLKLLERPNPYYSGALLWKATVADLALTGNGYWLKVRSQAGKVVQLWWAPSSMIEPKWPEDGLTFISHYEYKPDPLRDPLKFAEQDVIHFRDDIDPDNLRKGRSQLYSLMREIFTDEEAANLTASLMRNLGIPGVVLSPKGPGAGASPEAAEKIKEDFKAKFGGDRRGEPMVMTAPTDVSVLSFSPEQMNQRNQRRVPEERVTAVFGVAAVVVGLGAGLDRSTFTNFHEAREAAYEGNIIPTQKLRAADLRTQLLPDFDKRPSLDVEFDLSRVRVLQPDMDHLFSRMGAGVNAGFVMVSDARRAVGLPVNPEHDIFIRPMNMIEIPAFGGKAAHRGAVKAAHRGAVKAAKARTVAVRRQLAQAHRSLFEEVAASLVAGEEKDIMPLARRLLGPKKAHGTKAMADFVAANDAYYETYPSVVKKAMLPVVMTYGEAVLGVAAAEVGAQAAMTPEMMAFLDAYAEGIGTFWASSSRGQIRSVAEKAIAEGVAPVEALTGRFAEWAEKRPGKTGDWETSRLGSAVSTETYRKAGLSARWVAGADACPICDDMDGQSVTDLEPPLHTGCACTVEPG